MKTVTAHYGVTPDGKTDYSFEYVRLSPDGPDLKTFKKEYNGDEIFMVIDPETNEELALTWG